MLLNMRFCTSVSQQLHSTSLPPFDSFSHGSEPIDTPRTSQGAASILNARPSPGVSARESSGSICPAARTYKATKYFMTRCLPHAASLLNVERISLGELRRGSLAWGQV